MNRSTIWLQETRWEVSWSRNSSVHVYLSVRMEQLGCHWTNFYRIFYSIIFRSSIKKIKIAFKSDNNNGYFMWRPTQCAHMIISISILFRMKNISDRSCKEYQITYFICNLFFFRKSCCLSNNVEQYGRTGQATDDNTAHALCMLDN
jgi:hypothetical protein